MLLCSVLALDVTLQKDSAGGIIFLTVVLEYSICKRKGLFDYIPRAISFTVTGIVQYRLNKSIFDSQSVCIKKHPNIGKDPYTQFF